MDCFKKFSVLSWNLRGAVNVAGKRVVRELVKRYNPDIFIILEPHCTFDRVSVFWNKLGYSPLAISEAHGHAGGIWVLSLQGGSAVNASVVDIFNQVVSVKIGSGSAT